MTNDKIILVKLTINIFVPGQTCVHVAAMHGHLEVLRNLIWYGANINAREGCMGFTPLHCAVQTGNEDVVQFLLSCKNIDVETMSYGGKDALEINHRFVSETIRQALINKGLPSPYSSEDEYDSDTSEDEVNIKPSYSLYHILCYHYWLYNPWWVLACSRISFHSFLSFLNTLIYLYLDIIGSSLCNIKFFFLVRCPIQTLCHLEF
uniref:NF-kappa-B inhibitor cactus-like n=1 Tax=Diabrotica virgifera virgifera TaxID=50390 RepID=A0A6P7GZ17_DIAVI